MLILFYQTLYASWPKAMCTFGTLQFLFRQITYVTYYNILRSLLKLYIDHCYYISVPPNAGNFYFVCVVCIFSVCGMCVCLTIAGVYALIVQVLKLCQQSTKYTGSMDNFLFVQIRAALVYFRFRQVFIVSNNVCKIGFILVQNKPILKPPIFHCLVLSLLVFNLALCIVTSLFQILFDCLGRFFIVLLKITQLGYIYICFVQIQVLFICFSLFNRYQNYLCNVYEVDTLIISDILAILSLNRSARRNYYRRGMQGLNVKTKICSPSILLFCNVNKLTACKLYYFMDCKYCYPTKRFNTTISVFLEFFPMKSVTIFQESLEGKLICDNMRNFICQLQHAVKELFVFKQIELFSLVLNGEEGGSQAPPPPAVGAYALVYADVIEFVRYIVGMVLLDVIQLIQLLVYTSANITLKFNTTYPLSQMRMKFRCGGDYKRSV
eukprot:TRINITY_DN4476_c0_g1_i2.p1 TRINITY_DN4476_c0_g1~~TRINITY_DN4476_c0_g1_i2.p1  ORF type:complete len:437 (+),score=-19.37 TRINITY_DN4476_c0_g1_i2:720-2030(+)